MIYLDNSATTRPLEAALHAMNAAARECYFNPSSLYAPAMLGERLLAGAKDAVKAALGVQNGEVIFTSGGTEADNLAVLGVANALRSRKRHFLYGAAEHPAVVEAMQAVRAMGHDVERLPVGEDGAVRLDALEELIKPDTALVSVQHVNNETGAMNPIEQIAALVRTKAPDALIHTDGVQAFLHVPAALAGVDLYAVSAHKFHGPRGVGALWKSQQARLLPQAVGGGQQGGLRSGTENVPGVEGMRAAVDAYRALENAASKMMELKLRLYRGATDALPDALVNGPAPEKGAPHILNLSFGVRGEVLLHALEGEGILVSTGSACSSRKRKPSPVLSAMGLDAERIEGALRFSLSPMNTAEEIDLTIAALSRLVPKYRRYRRR